MPGIGLPYIVRDNGRMIPDEKKDRDSFDCPGPGLYRQHLI